MARTAPQAWMGRTKAAAFPYAVRAGKAVMRWCEANAPTTERALVMATMKRVGASKAEVARVDESFFRKPVRARTRGSPLERQTTLLS